MQVNDRLLDFQIAQQIRWLRVGNNAARKARRRHLLTDKPLKKFILSLDLDYGPDTFSPKRLAEIRREVAKILGEGQEDLAAEVADDAIGAALLSAAIEQESLVRAIPLPVDVKEASAVEKKTMSTPYMGAVLASWLAALKNNDISRTARKIQEGLIASENSSEIVASVIGTADAGFRNGVREVSRRGAEMAARTAIAHAASVGRQAVWAANADIISAVRWVSTLDGHTSDICRFRDGKTYPVDSGPRPPALPNCRSQMVAVVKSWQELGFDIDEVPLGTRASMNGQVPSDLTYQQWFLKQPGIFQKEVLGPTRFDLWKKGGATPDKFHNAQGFFYTLDELKDVMPEAFKAAF